MKCSDQEVEEAFAHYMLLGTVGEALELVKLGEPIDQDTKLLLHREGIEVDEMEGVDLNG